MATQRQRQLWPKQCRNGQSKAKIFRADRQPHRGGKRRAQPIAKAKAKPRPKQTLRRQPPREEDFEVGLRSYAHYRDLGIAMPPAAWCRRT